MDSPYSKQFPSLMKGKKIMYVHGFLSSAQSGTVKMLQELMPEYRRGYPRTSRRSHANATQNG